MLTTTTTTAGDAAPSAGSLPQTRSFTSTLTRLARRAASDIRTKVGFAVALLFAASAALYANPDNPCHCEVTATDAPLVEWDLPVVADFGNGAITVDVHSPAHRPRLWFVSYVGTPPRLFRFEVGKSMATSNATWTSYDLAEDSFYTGGVHRIKVHKDDQTVFVRTDSSLQRIDSNTCSTDPMTLMPVCNRVVWRDQLTDGTPHVSDLAIDDCYVYTTTAVFDSGTGVQSPGASYLQQLTACRNKSVNTNGTGGMSTVKRWTVGGSAGFCQMAVESSPCISGVDVDQRYNNLVYFSEPGANVIGELDVNTNCVRRWDITQVGASEPRQLQIDDDGMVWVVTGSGHLVRLDPRHNKMSAHMMPSGESGDPFGIAPDHGAIGYTNSTMDNSKVGMLLPKDGWHAVYPTSTTISPVLVDVPYTVESANKLTSVVPPEPKMAIAHVTEKPDGTYVEAFVGGGDSGNGSFIPRGVTPDFGRRVGSYFYAVEVNSDNGMQRIGHIQLPFDRKDHRFARDDDDHDGVHHGNGDDDDDGVKDGDDHDDHHEKRDTHSNEQVASGQSADYPMNADASTTLMTAILTPSDLGQMMAVEIYNPAGQLVASPLPAAGGAVVSLPPLTVGTYTVRVKNLGITPTTYAVTLLTTSVWPDLPDVPLP